MKIEQIANEHGMTVEQYLTDLFTRCRKIECAAREAGVNPHTLYNAAKRYGVRRVGYAAFEHDGIVDTLAAHCRRLGLNEASTNNCKQTYGLTGRQAIERMLSRRNHIPLAARARANGISPSLAQCRVNRGWTHEQAVSAPAWSRRNARATT